LLSAKKIAAGKSGQIETRIKTESFSGPVEKRITFTTNDPRNASVTLSIKAVVEPEFGVAESSIFFENIPAGIEVSKEIILTLPAAKPIKLLSAVSKDPNVAVRLEPVPGSNGNQMKLTATRKANVKSGYHFGQIVVKTTSRLTPEIIIYERGVVVPAGK
jgi:hypothetical protein